MKKLVLITAGLAAAAATCYGDAIIKWNDIYLGINDAGHLNVRDYAGVTNNSSYTGLTYSGPVPPRPAGQDATSPACLCEGWGVSGSGVSGWANVNEGSVPNPLGLFNLTVAPLVSDTAGGTIVGTTATSTVSLTSMPGLTVRQTYGASVSTALIHDLVTITNTTGADIPDLRYVRVMDWDVPPTEFSEYVTIGGTIATALETSHNNGFNTANPLGDLGEISPAGTTNVDFTDVGPADHGAYFKFNFGLLKNGDSMTFDIFYGAARNEAAALAALVAVGAEVYSLGQNSGLGGGPVENDEATFIFGFSNVGGVVVSAPDGGQTLMLLGASLSGLALMKRRLGRRA